MTRAAVAVLLTPDRLSDEVLLVRRSPELVFFGGYDAFPGGTLDPEDADTPLVNVIAPNGEGPDYSTFVAAAARELFEETGVLLVRGATVGPADVLSIARRRLLAGEATFAAILREGGWVVDGRDFDPICRITTPPFTPRRYDTWFFCSVRPPGARVEIWPGELVSASPLRAGNALDAWRRGERLIVPPVVLFLTELAERRIEESLPRICALTASYARGKLHRVYFTPGVLIAPLKTPTRPPATHTNSYVVGEERLYLVDPGPSDGLEQERLWELVDGLATEGRKLEGILLTHYHPDHIGAADEARRRYRVPLYAHADTVHLLPGLTFDRDLSEGETLPLGRAPDGGDDWKLHVYHVPGHAPGHLAFREDRYQGLLVGDLVSTLSSILVDPKDGNLRQYMTSLERLEVLADGTLFPGHGPPAREGRRAIVETIRHRKEREALLLAALQNAPASAEALVPIVYADVDPALHALAERSLLSGLIKLMEEGRVRRSGEEYALV